MGGQVCSVIASRILGITLSSVMLLEGHRLRLIPWAMPSGAANAGPVQFLREVQQDPGYVRKWPQTGLCRLSGRGWTDRRSATNKRRRTRRGDQASRTRLLARDVLRWGRDRRIFDDRDRRRLHRRLQSQHCLTSRGGRSQHGQGGHRSKCHYQRSDHKISPQAEPESTTIIIPSCYFTQRPLPGRRVPVL